MQDLGGMATMLGLFCEVNAGVLAIIGLQELTAIWDVAYSDGRARGHTDRAAYPWVSGACPG
jgi:hypothetical protein